MRKKMIGVPALAGIVALPLAAVATLQLMERPSPFQSETAPSPTKTDVASPPAPTADKPKAALPARTGPAAAMDEASRDISDAMAQPKASGAAEPLPAPQADKAVGSAAGGIIGGRDLPAAMRKMAAPSAVQASSESLAQDMPAPAEEDRGRLQAFESGPVKSVAENPVSTFSVDVDTASYSFVRSALKEGVLPQADTVRVEEMINYFPYDWKGPATAATPFNTTVTVMPTPWNTHTRLMHVAIKGYDVKPAETPKANLVFLIDTSGSMNEPDKLPLLKNAFRLLVDRLGADDTVSIVTYAGSAGTVLEPTRAGDKAKILEALDRLEAGGSTAGEAGIREAYRLAGKSFVRGGVNRVMLATDGDFNVGQTDDDDLKRLVETERKSGVFLSVFGFGRGNYNDEMMQVLAQNGNGAAAYIDTLSEAEKSLVQESSSTLFPIAKDVKLQVEFNPAAVSEYRLIGYETRALKREDFNNDRIDAGDIGSGHAVTAIYEITPKDSPVKAMDDLRYGRATVNNAAGVANPGEYAFVKIRYKLPDEDLSKLITTPVTAANEVPDFAEASGDVRFSVAVAAFGQKLRHADQTEGFGYDGITEIATAARGADPFGYRAEFLSLLRLASALDKND